MNLTRDHVAGAAFIGAGAVVAALSTDLPFGSFASPGAGMLPTFIIGLLIAFGIVLLLTGGPSPPLASLDWSDLPHAVRVVIASSVAVALYEWLGFVITMAALLFGLIFLIERKPLLPSVLFSAGLTVFAYVLFNTLLKAPLPAGLLRF